MNLSVKTAVVAAVALLVLTIQSSVNNAGAVTLADNMVPTANWYGHLCYSVSPTAGGPNCQTDNATLTIHREGSVSSSDQSMIATEIAADYAPTDFNITYSGTSTSYSGSAQTDIIYQTGSVSSGLIGMTWCDHSVHENSDYRCDQQYVRFLSGYSLDYELICHETGHAVGLVHGNRSADTKGVAIANSSGAALGCMETPDTLAHNSLNSLEVSEINATY